MKSAQMYELAKNAVIEYEQVAADDPVQPDVLWVGGVLEDRRAVVWYAGKLYMVRYTTGTGETAVDVYTKEA